MVNLGEQNVQVKKVKIQTKKVGVSDHVEEHKKQSSSTTKQRRLVKTYLFNHLLEKKLQIQQIIVFINAFMN